MKILVIVLIFLCASANADVKLQKIDGTENHTIKISKSVKKSDLDIFQKLLESIDEENIKLHMNAVQLDVFGGDPAAARDIGRIIRERGLNTFIAPKVDCVSACIYLAISGVHRMIYGSVLLHRPTLYKEELTPESVATSIAAHTKESNQYIAEMGGSILLAEAINHTPNWALRRLTDKEIKHWNIFGSEHVHDELMFRAAAKQAGVSNDKFKRAYVEYFDICRKEEYSFKVFAVDCTVAQLKRVKK
jgi:hypothetical protein